MDNTQWLAEYLGRYRQSIFSEDAPPQLIELKEMFVKARDKGQNIIIGGNGGSEAIASHCSVNFTKCAGVRCINFNEADLITCFANDYGYERWLEKALEFYADRGDILILISSSGKSPNMVDAARFACANGWNVVTFTGFSEDNSLKKLGDLNIWVDSRAYNVVEMTHQIWLLAVCDLIIVSAEYSAS